MPKRICWKKGMRLTDEVLRAADNCTAEFISQTLSLAACGRFGLIPALKPFQLQLSITKGFVDVEALTCEGITRGGQLISADFDTKFTNTLDSRIQIPRIEDEQEVLLTIIAHPDDLKETNDGYLEQNYSFALVSPKAGLNPYALPIARLVYEDGWREDNTNFVPPCLSVAAHGKYIQLFQQFIQMIQSIDDTARKQSQSAASTALSIFWPAVREQLIEAATLQTSMSPQQLQACVQKVVSAFVVGCELDELINLEDVQMYRNFSIAGYSYRMAYTRIKQGLGICYNINEKVEKFGQLVKEAPKPEPAPAPEPEPRKPTPPPVDPRRSWLGKSI